MPENYKLIISYIAASKFAWSFVSFTIFFVVLENDV